MKNDLKKYVLPLVYFFLLAICIVLWLLGGLVAIAMEEVESFIRYYKLSELGVTVSGLKLLVIVLFVIVIIAWFFLGVLVERKFNVHLFPNYWIVLANRYRVRSRPNLLKILSRQKKLSKSKENNDNAS